MSGKRYLAAPEQAYTVPDLAAAWRIDPTVLRRKVCAGEFPGAFKVGRDWRIPAEVARKWREDRTPFPAR